MYFDHIDSQLPSPTLLKSLIVSSHLCFSFLIYSTESIVLPTCTWYGSIHQSMGGHISSTPKENNIPQQP